MDVRSDDSGPHFLARDILISSRSGQGYGCGVGLRRFAHMPRVHTLSPPPRVALIDAMSHLYHHMSRVSAWCLGTSKAFVCLLDTPILKLPCV